MDLTLSREFAHIPGLWDQLQNLDWLRDSFSRGAEVLIRQINAEVVVDDRRSTLAFLTWSEKLSLQKRYSLYNRQAYCTFACGLLLADLIRNSPLTTLQAPRSMERSPLSAETLAGAQFWCEGFILTTYCANLLDAILQQDFNLSITFAPVTNDIRTWWSFRENAREEPARAIGFFDLFLGNQPSWQNLESFPARIGIGCEIPRGA